MPETVTRDVWTWRPATDEPATTAQVMASLKWWLVRYRDLRPGAESRSATGRATDRLPAEVRREHGDDRFSDLIRRRADLDRLLALAAKPKQRAAIALHLIDGCPLSATAKRLGVTRQRAAELVGKGLWRMAKALMKRRERVE